MSGVAEGFTGRLREAMRLLGVNDAELARRIGTSQSTVSGWFTRGTMPGAHGLALLGETLNVSLDWLLRGIGPMEPVDTDAYAKGAADALGPVLAAAEEAGHRAGLRMTKEGFHLAPPPADVDPG